MQDIVSVCSSADAFLSWFHFLAIVSSIALKWVCGYRCGVDSKSGTAGSYGSAFLFHFFFLNFHIDFHSGFAGFTVPPAMNKYSYFPTSSPVFVSSVFWLTATLTRVRGHLKATLICISLVIRMDALSSICWLFVFLRQRTAYSLHFLQFVFWLTR